MELEKKAVNLAPGILPVITRIICVWRFWRDASHIAQARSTPGHLLHLVVSGSYRLRTNGRVYTIRSNDCIYYHASENVEWLGNDEPVEFYSVGFLADSLPPLPVENRVFQSTKTIRTGFEELFVTSQQFESPLRNLRQFFILQAIVYDAWADMSASHDLFSNDNLWWRVEEEIRARHLYRPLVDDLCSIGGCSRATLVRACHAATGMSPMQRIREIRMEEARGLLLYSGMNVSQVAERLGYPRVHEFSREFHRACGMPPRQMMAMQEKPGRGANG